VRELLYDLTHPGQFWRRSRQGFGQGWQGRVLEFDAALGIAIALVGLILAVGR